MSDISDKDALIAKLQEDLEELQVELDGVKKHIALGEPSGYPGKKVFRVNLSIPPVLFWVFFFVALAFGMMGVMNARFVMLEGQKIAVIRESIEEDAASLKAVRDELKTANQKVLDEVWQTVPQVMHKLEEDISTRIAGLREEVDRTIHQLQDRSAEELEAFGVRLQRELNELDLDTQEVETILRSMSDVCDDARLAHGEALTRREQQVLLLLAHQLNPDNAEVSLESARLAYELGYYEEALEYLHQVFRSRGVDRAVRDDAKKLKESVEAAMENPQHLVHESPGRSKVGPYGIFALHYNTLTRLVENGTLTVDEAQAILEESKHGLRAQP